MAFLAEWKLHEKPNLSLRNFTQLPTIYISFSQNYNEYLHEEIHKWGINNTFKLKGFSLHSAFPWINSETMCIMNP